MGDSFETAVVNERGQVRSSETGLHDGLFVLDGSVVPTSLGCNPLLTITALAEYAMTRISPKDGHTSHEKPLGVATRLSTEVAH